MWSGLDPVGTKINPDSKMLRADVVNLIWKRNGSPEHDGASYAISNQGTNKAATSWAYTIGLVQGSDGYNLNLDKPLTRAEAATLIIRSRTVVSENKQCDFKDVVSDDILKQIYRSVDMFPNKVYDKNSTVTYGEMAHAAMILRSAGNSISYSGTGLDESKLFEHEYSKEFYAVSNKLWGMEYYSPNKIDQNVNVCDALTAIIYGLYSRGTASIHLGNTEKNYSDCVGVSGNDMKKLALSYGAYNGIKLTCGDSLGAEKEATLGDIALLILQLDDISGLEVGYSKGKMHSVKTNTDLSYYPANYEDYKLIIDGVPGAVYALKGADVKPASYYQTASQLSFVYMSYMNNLASVLKNEKNVDLTFTFYPSLAYRENGNIVFIAKCALASNVDLDNLFEGYIKENSGLISDGVVYVAFETDGPLMDLVLNLDDVHIKKIIAD